MESGWSWLRPVEVRFNTGGDVCKDAGGEGRERVPVRVAVDEL